MSNAIRIAALDIGSDTVHLLGTEVSEAAGGPLVVRRYQERSLTELGRRVAAGGRIGPQTAGELESVLRRFVKIGRRESERLVIGATEALRRAGDGPALVDHLSAALGQPIHVLSGVREAALGLTGAVHRLDPTGAQLLIDSGGASTELTFTNGHRAVASMSLPVGAALLAADIRGDPPEPLSWALTASRIGAALAVAPVQLPKRAWGTGGSAHNLAGLGRVKGRSGDQVLTMADLHALAGRLLAVPSRRLARSSGEDPARVAILAPGLLIIAAVLAHYRLDRITVVPEGLREGMAAAAFESGDDWWKDDPPKSPKPDEGAASGVDGHGPGPAAPGAKPT